MESYLNVLNKILKDGTWKQNRTGIDTISISGAIFEHNMTEGYPLLTTKEMRPEGILSELEFFIKGITSKKWLREQNNHIWDDWCNPEALNRYSFSNESVEEEFKDIVNQFEKLDYKPLKRVRRLVDASREYFDDELNLVKEADSYLLNNVRKIAQYIEDDLGPIYGWQWRHFGGNYQSHEASSSPQSADYSGEGFDQLENIVNGLKKSPESRRLICSAWNPKDIGKMALPPCHYGFQVLSDGENLDLIWQQRSVDTPLGLPYNIASYAALLHLLSKETGLASRMLIGQLGDVHIYKNQLDGIEEQLTRSPRKLPEIATDGFDSIFRWKYQDTKIENYNPHPRINFEIAV